MPETFIVDLDRAITAFESAMRGQREGRETHVVARAAIPQVMATGLAAVRRARRDCAEPAAERPREDRALGARASGGVAHQPREGIGSLRAAARRATDCGTGGGTCIGRRCGAVVSLVTWESGLSLRP
jgi:hypothetical protein